MKIGRNDPCPCGSGKKYKKCCYLRKGQPAAIQSLPLEVIKKFQEVQTYENERRSKYGEVRPIIHAKFQGYDFVAVGSELHYSKKWKTFPDFLLSYIATRLGKEWGREEIRGINIIGRSPFDRF